YHYLTLDYVCNQVNEGVKKVTLSLQTKMTLDVDLFSG
ncbi:MAG: hypothetical protein ACI9JN_000730, partial [Bacteroidia bacterium]